MADENAAPVEPAVPAKKSKKKGKKRAKKKANGAPGRARGGAGRVKFPKHSILDCIRIPQAIVDQHAGEACSDREGAAFAKIGWTGEIGVEISSAIKYKLLERPSRRYRPNLTDFEREAFAIYGLAWIIAGRRDV